MFTKWILVIRINKLKSFESSSNLMSFNSVMSYFLSHALSLPVCLAFLLARRVSSLSWMMTCSTRRKNFCVEVFEVSELMQGSWSSRPPNVRFCAATITTLSEPSNLLASHRQFSQEKDPKSRCVHWDSKNVANVNKFYFAEAVFKNKAMFVNMWIVTAFISSLLYFG